MLSPKHTSICITTGSVLVFGAQLDYNYSDQTVPFNSTDVIVI